MKIDKYGINLIHSFEGCQLKAYKCVPTERYYTIGWGHYGRDVKKDMVITQEQADNMFLVDIKSYENAVNNAVKVDITQSMFNACVSLCYNIGISAFRKSTVVKKLNKDDYVGACEAFAMWNKSGGKVLNGLVKRRAKEQDEFMRDGLPNNVLESFKIPSLKGYKGFSVVDGLKSFGYDSSFAYRKKIWLTLGYGTNYKGTSSQNNRLLSYLKTH